MQSLKELLRAGEAFSVDRDDEDEDVVQISYDELLANEYANRVEESIGVLSALEGVDEVWHEDREVVVVRGTRLSLATIETALREFWSSVPRLPARWTEETKIVERALIPILKPEQFRKRGLTWNRVTTGGLIHVVHLYRTNYEDHDRPGIMLTVGVYCREVTAARHYTGPERWVDGSYCHFTWEPASDRPQYFTDTWPLDEDCDSVAREMADRVRDEFLPALTRLQTPSDVVTFTENFTENVPSGRYAFNVFDRITFLAISGRADEARSRLQAEFDQRGHTQSNCLKVADLLGLPLTGTT